MYYTLICPPPPLYKLKAHYTGLIILIKYETAVMIRKHASFFLNRSLWGEGRGDELKGLCHEIKLCYLVLLVYLFIII